MAIDDYVINPREVPTNCKSLFGEWMAERPLKIDDSIRHTIIILPTNWQESYRLLPVTIQGKEVYRRLDKEVFA